MRGPLIIAGLIAGTMLVPATVNAQFNPGGIIGAVTAPLRGMIERLPHPPIRRRAARNTEAGRQPSEQELAKLGLTGPMAWPTAYEDVLGYTFWPDDYGKDFRQHGFSDIVATLIGPLDLAGPVVGTAARGNETTGAASGNVRCDEAKPTDANWPASQIDQTIELTPAQRTALERMQATATTAINSIKANCPDATALTSRQRLSAMVQRLWAVQNAGVLIRAQLESFYNTLTDDQKAKFNAPPPAESRGNTNKAASRAMGRQYAACAAQGSNDADRLIKQIGQTVRPTNDQRASLEAFGHKTGEMAKLLMASCAQPVPETPPARLDAANARLTNINFAATTIEVALNEFYAGLTKEQQAKFDALGR